MMCGFIKFLLGNVICWFYGYGGGGEMNFLKGYKIIDFKEIKVDKLGYLKIKDVYLLKI